MKLCGSVKLCRIGWLVAILHFLFVPVVLQAQNLPPVPSHVVANQHAVAGTSFSLTIPANAFRDDNGDVLTYSVSGLPPGLSYNTGTRIISGTPASSGTSTVTITASDGAASRSKTFTITVHPSGTQTYAAFTMSTKEGCNFKQISFSNKSKGMTSFEWDFDNGDDPVTTIQNPSAIFNRPGTYNVTLTINGGGSSALVHTETITIHSLPSPQITKPIDTGCEPYNTEITGSSGTSSPAYHYWYFFEKSPGQFTSSPNVSLSNLEAGEYSVILQVTDQNGCKGSKIENNLFRIYEIPSADFAYKKSDNCNPSLTTFTDRSIVNDGAISNYRWTVNGNTQSTNNDTLKYNFTTNGEFPVTLQTQSEHGCWSDTYSNTIVFNDNNTANFSVNNNYCTSDIVDLSAVTSQGAISYTWDIGNNGSVESTEKDYSHQFNNAGRYDIKLSVSFNDDCNVEVIKTVNVDQITPSFSYNPTYNCKNNTFNVDFNNTSSSHLSNPISTSRWYLVSGLQETLISENNTFTRSFNQPGTYTIKLYTESNNGCSASLTQQIRLQEPSVTIAIGGDVYGCLAGNNVTFDATFTSNFETATSYQWNFGDGQSASGKTTSHQYTSAGNYNISVTVETSSGCSYTTTENNAVQLATPPVITSVDNNQQASQCFGQDLRLNISYTSGTDYLQIASNQGIEEVSNPGSSPYQYWYTPNDTGKVTFNIRAGQYGCLSDAYTVNNIRFNEPRAMFSPSNNIFCDQPYQATFINESDYTDIANTEFYWNFGDGGNSSETSPSHSYTQPGSYTVSLTVSNTSTGCSDTYSEEINIYSFNNTENIIQANKTNTCLNSPVRFSSRMSDYLSPNYEIQELRWDFNNDGTPDSIIYTDMSVDYSYTAPGIYSVSLEVIGVGGCDYLFTENNFITVSGPIIDYINYSPNPLCSGNQATFSTNTRKLSFDTADEENYNYLWNFGDGTSTGISPTHTFSKDTTYTVSLTVTDENNCQTTRTQPNLIQLIPFTANFSLPSSIICNDTEIEIENNSTGNISQCLWDFNGDGTIDLTTGNANNVTYNFPTPGTYNVKLTTQVSTGCTKEYTEQITVVYASAEFSAAAQNIGCAPAFANFEPYAHNDEVIAYTWNFGDGKTSNERSPQHLYVSPGKYTVSLRIDFIGGCSKTVEKTNYIIVDGAYGVLNYDNTPGCAPYTTSFSVSEMSRVDYITWDFGAGETVRDTVESTYFETTYTYNEMGARTPKVILTDKVCGDYEYSNPTKGSIYTSIPPTPNFTVNFDSVCRDVPILFTDQSTSPDPQYDVANWKWFFGNSQNDSATVETPSFAYPEKGLYSPTLIVSNELGCSDTLTKENSIRIFDNLNLTSNFIISKELACPADRITFRSTAGSTPEAPIVKYEWNFGEGIEQGGTTEYHSYDKSYKGQSIEIIHKVTDNRFCTDSTIRTVEISNLQAAFGYDPQPVFRGSTVDFNDQSTTDAGTQINSWQWNFGNGSPQSSSAENPNNIAYNTIMSDNNVSLIVTNDIGCKDTVARSFDVRNNPPDLDDFTITLIENSSYSFKITDFTDHYSDLDNHSLQTIKIENEAPNGLFRYNGAQYIIGTEIPVNNIPLLTFIPNQDWHGQTDCNWTAYDGINWGASPDINFNILERPAPPELKDVLIEIPKDSVINITRQHFINSIQTTLGNLFQFDSLQILTNHTPQNAGQLLFNNQPVNIPMLILDNEIDNNNAVFEFTPTPNFGGDVSFEWNVFDGFNFADNNGYVIIRYLNSAPQLSDIIYTDVPEDQQVIINKQVFIDHFSDNDIYDIPVTLYISDLPPSSEGVFLFNNQEIRSNFQVSFAQFNQIIFVPAAGFEGTISPTTWKASDGTDTGEAIIQMSFVNTPPIVNDVSVSGFEDTELSLRTINFDNTSTQSPFVDQNPNDRLEAIKILSLPENGTFTFQGAEIVPGDSISRIQIQQVKYMPNSNWFGNTSFEYNAFDGTHWAETPASVFITIQPVNDAPITNSNHYTMLESTVLSNKNISINDSDIDNNISELTYSVAVTDSSTAGQHGNINLLNNGMLTYTPNRYYNGTVEFIYTVCDPENACSKDTVTIRILPINDAPVAYNDTVIIYENERTQSFNCIDNDIDIDGDLPALTHVDGQETSPNVNEYGLIDWDAAGNITFTLDDELQNLSASDALTTQVNYTITDDSLATSNATIYFIIRGINDAPVATNDEFYTTEGFNYISSSDAAYSNILHNDIDPENETISVVSINNTSENEIDGTYGKLLWNSTGWWRFEEKFNATNSLKQGEIAETTYPYTITDGIDNSQTPGYISIYITGVNDSPVAVNDTITIKENIGELFVDDLNPNVLLRNDSDIDNDEIYIIKVNDTVDNTITTDVGELRWNHNGTYRYTPRIDSVIKLSAVEVAYDIFEYTIIDAFGATASALLVIEIEGLNDAPFAQNDTIVIMEDTHTTVVPEEEGLLINDGDIDDDPIIVSVNEDNTYTSHGIYGTLTWEPSGAYIYTSYPEIVDSLYKDEIVNDIFSYTVLDPRGLADKAKLIISIVGENDAPQANNFFAYINEKDPPLSVNNRNEGILSNDTDIDDGDNFEIIDISQNSDTLTYGTYGELNWNSDGTFIYTLNPETDTLSSLEIVADSFLYTIEDRFDSTDFAWFIVEITGINDNPVAVADTMLIFEDEASKEFNPEQNGVLWNDYDIDGDSVWVLLNQPTINIEGTYGTLSLSDNGDAIYNLI